MVGCGTISNLGERPRIYGGVREDAKLMETTGPCSSWPAGCMDMPFSLILDTVLLPFTLIYELASPAETTPERAERP